MIHKKLSLILMIATFASANAIAKDDQQYPNISGKALFEFRADRAAPANRLGIHRDNSNVNVNTNFSLNFSKNWSLITEWRFEPMYNQNNENPERYRQIFSNKRVLSIGQNNGLAIDQLKGQFENEDARFFFGKFNPDFGSAFRKEKRIGVFTTDFTKDYEMRGKIGAGFSALLEKNELTISTFFNDDTSLNDSAIHKKGSDKRSDGVAGRTFDPSSFNASLKGQDLLGVHDLFYNFAYKNLNVDNVPDKKSESGLVGGLEYLIPISLKTSLIPFIEVASLENLRGEKGRNATYVTMAVVAKYSGWTTSVSSVIRSIQRQDITNPANNIKSNDSQIQLSIGYKFSNNIAIDVSRASLKEDNLRGTLFGVLVSYVHNF